MSMEIISGGAASSRLKAPRHYAWSLSACGAGDQYDPFMKNYEELQELQLCGQPVQPLNYKDDGIQRFQIV